MHSVSNGIVGDQPHHDFSSYVPTRRPITSPEGIIGPGVFSRAEPAPSDFLGESDSEHLQFRFSERTELIASEIFE